MKITRLFCLIADVLCKTRVTSMERFALLYDAVFSWNAISVKWHARVNAFDCWNIWTSIGEVYLHGGITVVKVILWVSHCPCTAAHCWASCFFGFGWGFQFIILTQAFQAPVLVHFLFSFFFFSGGRGVDGGPNFNLSQNAHDSCSFCLKNMAKRLLKITPIQFIWPVSLMGCKEILLI